MRGNITRRGKSSWRLKFDVGRDPATGERLTRLVTVKGKRQDAEKELTRLLATADAGAFVEPDKVTVTEFLRSWIDRNQRLSLKTAERFRQLIEQQMVPLIGATLLQRLKPAQVINWHARLLQGGGKGGKPLSPSTVRQAHRVLHMALGEAAKGELVARNVVAGIAAPKVEKTELHCLRAEQISVMVAGFAGHWLAPIVTMALASGMRRGELLALRWSDVDLEGGGATVQRSLEQTKTGLRFKAPKTAYSRRQVALPSHAVEALKVHRRAMLEQRLALGQGKPDADALVFCNVDGSPLSPVRVSGAFRDTVALRNLPVVTFHALRHSHASALICSGIDVLTVSRRLGHASPVITLSTYGHLMTNKDESVRGALENALGTVKER